MIVNVFRRKVFPMTFVMHSFMDADHVSRAHELNVRNEWSDDPQIRETQERLRACSYSFSHPETGQMIPGCVQHSVLDPEENKRLKGILPIAHCCENKDLEW